MLASLRAAGTHFVVIGGVAMIAHGSSYITEDLDIVYERSAKNIAAVVRALEPLHPRLRLAGEPAGLPFVFDEATLRNGLNFTLTTNSGDVDLFGQIPGIGGYAEASANADLMVINGGEYEILSLAGLISAKRATGRLKDRQALPELEHLLEISRLEEQDV